MDNRRKKEKLLEVKKRLKKAPRKSRASKRSTQHSYPTTRNSIGIPRNNSCRMDRVPNAFRASEFGPYVHPSLTVCWSGVGYLFRSKPGQEEGWTQAKSGMRTRYCIMGKASLKVASFNILARLSGFRQDCPD
uniref:Uncharacterized protein n=1 Tax=Rhodosorus marinus TaxID=101924 RepID=A0A7S3EE28_9RHOD